MTCRLGPSLMNFTLGAFLLLCVLISDSHMEFCSLIVHKNISHLQREQLCTPVQILWSENDWDVKADALHSGMVALP